MENINNNARKEIEIDIIEPSGFCNGVSQAIKKVKETRYKFPNKKIILLGQLVHNEHVMNELKNLNIEIFDIFPDEYEDAIKKLSNECIVVFSAHGHDRRLDTICEKMEITFVDTICPIVREIENSIKNVLASSNDNEVIYIGKNKHAETYSALSISNKVNFYDINSTLLVYNKYKIVNVFNQTTISPVKIKKIHEKIKNEIHDNLQIKDTICKYIKDRFVKANDIDLLNNYDAAIVIGSKTSSNTVELYDEIKKNKKDTFLVTSKYDAIRIKNKDYTKIAIFSGTSTSIDFINKIIKIIKQ